MALMPGPDLGYMSGVCCSTRTASCTAIIASLIAQHCSTMWRQVIVQSYAIEAAAASQPDTGAGISCMYNAGITIYWATTITELPSLDGTVSGCGVVSLTNCHSISPVDSTPYRVTAATSGHKSDLSDFAKSEGYSTYTNTKMASVSQMNSPVPPKPSIAGA